MYVKNLLKHLTYKVFAPGALVRAKYEAFRSLLEANKKAHELMAELEQIYHERVPVDFAKVEARSLETSRQVGRIVEGLGELCPPCYLGLHEIYQGLEFNLKTALAPPPADFSPPFTLPLAETTPAALPLVGGKAYALGLIRNRLKGPVPEGFVITTNSFNYLLEYNDLRPRIKEELAGIDIDSIATLERASGELAGLMLAAEMPSEVDTAINEALGNLGWRDRAAVKVSVRSSARGEDGSLSFAGQYLTVLDAPLSDLRHCYLQVLASTYSPGPFTTA